jgi:hypothetical protein
VTRRFDAARDAGRRVLDVFPEVTLYLGNYALYNLYTGDLETAVDYGRRALASPGGASYHLGHLPAAIDATLGDDPDQARLHYDAMRQMGDAAESLALHGLADVALYAGAADEAASLLREGIDSDEARANAAGATRKRLLLSRALESIPGPAAAAEDEALLDGLLADPPAAAELRYLLAERLLQAGRIEDARIQGEALRSDLQPGARAYGQLIDAEAAYLEGNYPSALDATRAALAQVDLWLGRLLLARIYAAAGYVIEARDELDAAERRLGEGIAVFLDDVPTTYRIAALRQLRAEL